MLKTKIKKIYSHLNPSINHKMRLYYAENYESMPIDENKIVYETRDGKSIVDSPYAMFLYLANQPVYEKFQHVWVINKDEDSIKNIIPENLRHKVTFVVRETIAYVNALLSAKYLISNSTFESFFSKRSGQVYINTWHGTPLKYMGFDIPFSISASQNVLRNFLMTDYLLSPNAHTSDIFIKGYKLDGIYPGEVLEGGYPRIDQTINLSRETAIKKINSYGVKVDSTLPIILYTPTWKGKNVNQANDDVEQIINETLILVNKFKKKYQVLVKVHPFIFDVVSEDDRIKDYLVSDYIDANEALAATDLLVTDYSSIFFDYLVTDKPILFYVWDKDLYEYERGMYLEDDELPGPAAENLTELIHLIENIEASTAPYKERYLQLKKRMVPYDDGKTTKRYIDYIFKQQVSDKIRVRRVDSNKTKLLLYPGGMKDNGITTSFLNLTNNIDYSKYDVTVIGNPPTSREVENNYNRMNKNVRPLFRFGIDILTKKERRINREFMARGVPDNRRNNYPEIGYRRETNRLTASLKFDTAIDFSGYSYFWGRYILGAQADKYCAFMHNDLYADAHREVNGKMPMLRNLTALFTLYYKFNRLLSVSPMTMDVNKEKLARYITDSQMGYVVNTINIEKILESKEDSNQLSLPSSTDIQNIVVDRRFLSFYRDGEITVYKNMSAIQNNTATTFTIKKTDKVSEFAQCTLDDLTYSKVSINGMYVGWIESNLLVERPVNVINHKKIHIIGTISRYLSYRIWKHLNLDGTPREALTKLEYFKGQYLEATELWETDQGNYYRVRYLGKELGFIAVRCLTRTHTLISGSPLALYFNNRTKKIDKEKRIGFSDTLVTTKIYGLVNSSSTNKLLYSEPPKTTGSKILEEVLSDYKNTPLFINEIQFVDGQAYARILVNGQVIGYTETNNIDLTPWETYRERLNESIATNQSLANIKEEMDIGFNFVTMGRLSPEKNQIKLIEGFAKFHQKHSDSKLYILGKGPLESQLADKISELQLESAVFLKGHMQDPFAFVAQANVFILPSLYEGQPMVLLESLTLGMKILASNIPANVQVIGKDETYGMLTNGTETEDIYEGMLRIFNFKGSFKKFDYLAYNQQAINNFYQEVEPNK